MARTLVGQVEGEFRRYRLLAERAIAQLREDELVEGEYGVRSSIATIVWHVAGNLRSRFTDFLTTDGEKPWRKRDTEFEDRRVTREELIAVWDSGWDVLIDSLADLSDADLGRTVEIRGNPLTVAEALFRALAHVSYHVGQIVYVAKEKRGSDWESLSIPPGGSEQYAENPTLDKPPPA